MKRSLKLLMLVVTVLVPAAPWPVQAEPAAQKFPNYFTIKGGYYYPSKVIGLNEFSGADFDKKKGLDAEIAVGHHYGSLFGMEFGVGYLNDRRFPATGEGRTKLEAIPILLSAKLFLPIGPIEPYGEIGVGAYFTKLEIEGAAGGNRSFNEVDWGPHAGIGLNVNLTDTFYVGAEGRYRWVNPDYGGQNVRLDGYTATVNLGFRY